MRYVLTLLMLLGAVPAKAQQPPSLPDGTVITGHIVATPGNAGAPTVAGASCGSPVLTAGSTDLAGEFQAKGTTTCAVTFGKAFASTPFCEVHNRTTPGDAAYTYATSGTTTTGFTMGTTASNDFIVWHCFGQQGN